MSTATLQPITLAAEVWSTPDDSNSLRPVSSLGELPSPATAQIVEQAAKSQSPIIVNVAKPNGSTSGCSALVCIPIMVEQRFKSCLVLSVECSPTAMGAIEIWSRDDREELGLNGAIFAGLGRFATISEYVRFPRSSGLPGQSWEDREVKLLTGLGHSPSFMRAAGARAGGLDIGIALPVMTTEHNLNSVMLFLSSKSTPLARLFEVWDIQDDQAILRTSSKSELNEPAESAPKTCKRGEGLVGKVWQTGNPIVTADLTDSEQHLLAETLNSAIAIPIYVGDRVKSVVLMMN